MLIRILFVIFTLVFSNSYAQETNTPTDFRQHNLGNFNSNILNPAFSYARNENPTVFFWGRTQWTDLEYSPESYFINYTQRINDYSATGLGGFLHDTGIFETGGFTGNYAYAFDIGKESQISLGINVIGSIRKLHKFLFTRQQYEALAEEQRENFTLAVMPGIVFTSGNLTLGVASENLIDYDLTSSESASNDKIFMIHAGYKIEFRTSGTFFENGSLSGFSFVKKIPEFDTQFGGSVLMEITHGWMQAGYNNFYGPSIGLGLKVNQFRLGGIVELPNAQSNENLGTTFEIILGWSFGEPRVNSRGFSGPEKKKKPKKKKIEKKTEPAVTEVVKDTTSAVDSLKIVKPVEKVIETPTPKPAKKVDEPEPGFYLIVNVFKEETNFKNFLDALEEQGLKPGYFIDSTKNWYYVYLERYFTLQEASSAKRSRFNGRYNGDSWIYRVDKN